MAEGIEHQPDLPDSSRLDPELQAALKRVSGGHAAAGELRQRITAMMQAEAPPAVAGRIGPARWRWTRTLALAACALLVVGAAAVYIHHYLE